jgi:hypothetical protein
LYIYLGFLYEFFGKRVPFISLSLIALLDGILLLIVMGPTRFRQVFDFADNCAIQKPKGTPIWRLLMDPYIAVCAGALAMVRRKKKKFFFIFDLFKRRMLVWHFLNQQYQYGCVNKCMPLNGKWV